MSAWMRASVRKCVRKDVCESLKVTHASEAKRTWQGCACVRACVRKGVHKSVHACRRAEEQEIV